MHRLSLAFAALALPSPALAADDPAAACPSVPVPSAGRWVGWNGPPRGISAGTTIVDMPALAIGAPIRLRLSPPDAVTPVVAPGRPLDPARFSGLVTISVPRAGRVGIALSDAASIDVVSKGEAQASLDHGHGPDCSGIRQILWFDLQPGTHIVQIVNNPDPEITAMAVIA